MGTYNSDILPSTTGLKLGNSSQRWTIYADTINLPGGATLGVLPQTLASVSHKWLKSYDATTGLFTQTQPTIADVLSANLCNAADQAGATLSAKINACDTAMTALGGGTIMVGGGGSLASTVVNISSGNTLYFQSGTYTSSLATAGAAIVVDNNTQVRCDPSVILTEPTGAGTWGVVWALHDLSNPDTTTNIHVSGCHFKGANAATSSVHSTVRLGNCINCSVTDNYFDQTTAFPFLMGGSSANGYHATNYLASGNRFYRTQASAIGPINCINCQIVNNFFWNIGTTADAAQIIDVEPNASTDIVSSLLIANNTILQTENRNAGFPFGITVQNGNGAKVEDIAIIGNTIYTGGALGGHSGPYINQAISISPNGHTAYFVKGLVIANNEMGCCYALVRDADFPVITGNTFGFANSGTGAGIELSGGTRYGQVYGNTLIFDSNTPSVSSIVEVTYTATPNNNVFHDNFSFGDAQATAVKGALYTILGANSVITDNVSNDTTTNATMYPVWVTASSGFVPYKVSSSKLSFNPSTGTLTATAFSGTVTNATNVAITDDTATNATMYPTWVTTASGNRPVKVTSTKFTFNPSTGTATSTHLVGSTDLVVNSGTALTTTNQTGTGSIVLATSPTLVTPTLGVASATSITTTAANGGLDGTEGTGAGLTAASGHDLLYPDSTAHRWKMNNNNGGAVQVVASGVDINTSDQVTATHLAAALPINQGGTATTAPGFSTLTDGATVTWAIASALVASAGLTFTTHGGNRTLNITNPVTGGTYALWIKQDGTGGEGLILGTGCTWKVSGGGAGAVTASTAASAIDLLTFTYDGTNCYANFNKNFS